MKQLSVFFILIVLVAISSFFTNRPIQNEAREPEALSREAYVGARNEFLELMRARDPAFALAVLRERVKTDNALLRSCHVMAHEIGRAAYETYGDFGEAMKYQDEICNSGYLHGIIESYFSRSDDVFRAMQTVCDPYPRGKYLSWECYHGTGHGAMFYTDNDLPKSLALCDGHESSFARSACTNGVFMENFNTDQKLHPSLFLKAADPFYPCAEQNARHKADCYLYAPTYYLSLHQNDYTGALRWCEAAEHSFQSICTKGVGIHMMKENINVPKLVEEICMKNEADQVVPCIDGMVYLFILHHGSLDPARTLCKQLEYSNRQACYAAIQSSAGLFD